MDAKQLGADGLLGAGQSQPAREPACDPTHLVAVLVDRRVGPGIRASAGEKAGNAVQPPVLRKVGGARPIDERSQAGLGEMEAVRPVVSITLEPYPVGSAAADT